MRLRFPESCGYDAKGKVLYVGNFGGAKLDPAAKDGLGYISKVGLNGKVLEEKFLPAAGGEALNKPKGIWIRGERLWVTDIDVVWIFDLKTRKGRKLALPGVGFANDPAVAGNALYISDNRNDKLVKVEPADFLNAKKEPSVTQVFAGASVNPNGLERKERRAEARGRLQGAGGLLRRAGRRRQHDRRGAGSAAEPAAVHPPAKVAGLLGLCA